MQQYLLSIKSGYLRKSFVCTPCTSFSHLPPSAANKNSFGAHLLYSLKNPLRIMRINDIASQHELLDFSCHYAALYQARYTKFKRAEPTYLPRPPRA